MPVAPPPPAPAPAPPRRDWRGLRQPAVLGGLALAGCAYLWVVDPNTTTSGPPCPLHGLTGLDCPGCGITRATHALLHGEVGRALDHNLLYVLALPFLLYALVRWGAGRVGVELPPRVRWQPWMTALGVVVVLGYLVVRNLPWFPYLDARA